MPPAETAAPGQHADHAEPIPPRRSADLLACVCHDLKAPLASIVMGAGFLHRVLPPEDATALRVVDAIRRAAERMDQLVVGFADLARLDMKDIKLETRPHLVGPIVRSAIDDILPHATAESVSLSLQLSPEVSTLLVECDSSRLAQILRQLLACALRVAPDGGKIAMRVGIESPGLVRFGVEADQNARFGGELPKPHLAIARGLIELHGALLSTVSRGNAHEMSFALPRVQAAPS